MKNRALTVLIFVSFLFEASSAVFAKEDAVDPREAAIDRAIGGMQEGSRPLSSQGDAEHHPSQQEAGSKLSPSMDTRVTAVSPKSSAGAIAAKLTPPPVAQEPVAVTPPPVVLEPAVVAPPATPEPAGDENINNSIIDLDANVDLSGGTPAVDANLSVDTNAEGGLLDASAVTTTDAVATDASVVESGVLEDQDLTAVVETAPVDATLDAEVIATGMPAGSEPVSGLEAEVDPVSVDETMADPPDGLVI